MNCVFCGGDLLIHNAHWIDPFVECSCTPHLMRKSEMDAHMYEKEKEQGEVLCD
ncbi:hypothetical protein NVP1238A_21 [Vibrio phage 1.238.A._10N.261.52.F10]|uniref:Uncharacterized protein n=2 Tax=Pariacacavirus TaxID=2948856 RepID=A0A2I7RUD5_9CAUD|nr:hypothetical protein KNT79_gp21 [Vibrio phage 1.238.A._10N.261.52.F10]YP_010093467.1 hypothetical protein KNT80_gp24 [Vibrio phage 1.245.O._10N.261.54.C7]AUR97270.1 hypothetical protein NVP1238A_21 [Vibrio phage 1.238.A._10N.261.52.F10]AUR97364.1 hypothetical protein NVP1238B_22 [Vibrio phage 1.238.B._10N.261.52.F10]AUR97937.1 hypothetical protein NVP1245O_24 [Vibrio phage 1.245.O._10N.261.54.C7]